MASNKYHLFFPHTDLVQYVFSGCWFCTYVVIIKIHSWPCFGTIDFNQVQNKYHRNPWIRSIVDHALEPFVLNNPWIRSSLSNEKTWKEGRNWILTSIGYEDHYFFQIKSIRTCFFSINRWYETFMTFTKCDSYLWCF